MRKRILVIAILALAGSIVSSAQELTKQAKVEKILDLTNSQATMNQMLDQITASMNGQLKAQIPNATPEKLAQMQEVQKKLMDLVRSKMSWDKMRPEMVRIYTETYSDEELTGMLAFFESPAGQGFVKKTPLMAQKMLAVSQKQMGDIMPEIQRIVKESAPPPPPAKP